MPADGATPTQTATATPAAPAGGGSILTEAAAAAPPAGAAAAVPAKDGADQALADAKDGPPEWAPAKYWDKTTKALKVEDLAKGYSSLEKLLSRDKVPVPVNDEDEEGWQRWYAATGRPEDPEKYEFKRPDLPPDLPYDDEREKYFRSVIHEAGLSQKQAAKVYEAEVKLQIERAAAWHTSQKQARVEAEQAIVRKYGAKLDQARSNVAMAMTEFASEDFKEYLDQTGLGNDPRMFDAMESVGRKLGGDTRLQGKVAPEANPADVDRAIADFRSRHKEALHSREHPDHKLRLAEMESLYQKRFGE